MDICVGTSCVQDYRQIPEKINDWRQTTSCVQEYRQIPEKINEASLPAIEFSIVNGVITGEVKLYDRDGKLFLEGEYLNDLKHNEWLYPQKGITKNYEYFYTGFKKIIFNEGLPLKTEIKKELKPINH